MWAKDMNRHLCEENTQMTNKYMKKCSASFIIRECKSNYNEISPHTNQNDHQKYTNKCCRGLGKKGTPGTACGNVN